MIERMQRHVMDCCGTAVIYKNLFGHTRSVQRDFTQRVCQVTHVTDLMFIMFLCLFNNQIVSVAHSRVTFWLPPRCEPV